MTSVIIMSFGVCVGLLLPLMSQPLSLGLVIMVLALFSCLLISMFISSWYGYILFLIFVGGLLVMFSYVAALCPNLLFQQSAASAGFVMVFLGLVLVLYGFSFMDIKVVGDIGSMKFKWMSAYGLELVSPSVISVLVGLGLILLINLVVVVKICFYQHGALRPFKA